MHFGTYSLTRTQKVRVPIGRHPMFWCDQQKGVGRHLGMWRPSDRGCGPRVRCSPTTGGKEIGCPASGKRWDGWSEYEIGGGRDGTWAASGDCLASYGHLAFHPDFCPPDSFFSSAYSRRSFNFHPAYPSPTLMAMSDSDGLDSAPGTDSGSKSHRTIRTKGFLEFAGCPTAALDSLVATSTPMPQHGDPDPRSRRSSFPPPAPLTNTPCRGESTRSRSSLISFIDILVPGKLLSFRGVVCFIVPHFCIKTATSIRYSTTVSFADLDLLPHEGAHEQRNVADQQREKPAHEEIKGISETEGAALSQVRL